MTLRQREHAVDGEAGRDALTPEAFDLVRHQRHERRDDHCQRARLVESGKSGELIADGLACAGRQNPELALTGEPLGDDLALQRFAVRTGGFRPECLEAEPAIEQQVRIVLIAAPGAVRVRTRAVAELSDELGRARETMSYSRWHDGVTAGDRNP